MTERRLLFMMKPEQLEAFLRLQRAAESGDGAAACRLGDMYREGLGGLRYSPKQTYRWYAKSALAGDANGQNNLGACYEHGLGCVQSYAKAVKWYRLAAAQGLAYASSNLGYCHWRGHGVGMDLGRRWPGSSERSRRVMIGRKRWSSSWAAIAVFERCRLLPRTRDRAQVPATQRAVARHAASTSLCARTRLPAS